MILLTIFKLKIINTNQNFLKKRDAIQGQSAVNKREETGPLLTKVTKLKLIYIIKNKCLKV